LVCKVDAIVKTEEGDDAAPAADDDEFTDLGMGKMP